MIDYESIRPYTSITTKVILYLIFVLFLYFIYKVHLKKERVEKPVIRMFSLVFWAILIIPSAIIILLIISGAIIGLVNGNFTFPLAISIILLIMVAFLVLGIVGLRELKKYQ